jgi:thiamine biosynthesis lipoprotein
MHIDPPGPQVPATALPLLARQVISGPTMGTRYAAVFFAPAECDLGAVQRELQAVVDMVDAQMSTWKPESDLMRLNRAPVGEWVDVPELLLMVLEAAMAIGRASDGAFDIGVGDVVAAWGFGSALGVRDPEKIAEATARAKQPAHLGLELDSRRGRVRKLEAVTVDLSGIAKGFGVDELARVLITHGIGHFLVSIDGELRAEGGKPDGMPWRVAVESPKPGQRQAEGVVELFTGAVATSGDYRHFVEIGGTRYAHTIDPRTGAPLVGGAAAVTVRAESCMEADAWATALLVLGPERGMDMAAARGIEALFVA